MLRRSLLAEGPGAPGLLPSVPTALESPETGRRAYDALCLAPGFALAKPPIFRF